MHHAAASSQATAEYINSLTCDTCRTFLFVVPCITLWTCGPGDMGALTAHVDVPLENMIWNLQPRRLMHPECNHLSTFLCASIKQILIPHSQHHRISDRGFLSDFSVSRTGRWLRSASTFDHRPPLPNIACRKVGGATNGATHTFPHSFPASKHLACLGSVSTAPQDRRHPDLCAISLLRTCNLLNMLSNASPFHACNPASVSYK